MHILFSALGYKPAYRLGGPISSVANTAEALVRLGHRVSVFTTNGNLDVDLDVPTDRPVEVNGVQVWYFRRMPLVPRVFQRLIRARPSVGFLYAPQLASALNRILPSVDVVHTQNPFIYPTLVAGNAAIRAGIPLFYQQRGALGPEHLKSRRYKKLLYFYALEQRLLRRATGLIALTPAEVAAYRALGIQSPCHTIPNGIDCSAYRTRPIAPLPESWHIRSDDDVVLFMGRLHHTKGVDRLVDAFCRIHANFPHVKLVLAGPDESGLRLALEKKLISANASRQVLFTGLVSGERKLDLLARANLFCLPSQAEGFSMSILEALASETPVLISPECNFPEVENSSVGRVVPSEPSHIAAELKTLLSDRHRLTQMGRVARTFVKANYDIDSISRTLAGIYDHARSMTGRPVLARAA